MDIEELRSRIDRAWGYRVVEELRVEHLKKMTHEEERLPRLKKMVDDEYPPED